MRDVKMFSPYHIHLYVPVSFFGPHVWGWVGCGDSCLRNPREVGALSVGSSSCRGCLIERRVLTAAARTCGVPAGYQRVSLSPPDRSSPNLQLVERRSVNQSSTYLRLGGRINKHPRGLLKL